jgi:hypothetical protein
MKKSKYRHRRGVWIVASNADTHGVTNARYIVEIVNSVAKERLQFMLLENRIKYIALHAGGAMDGIFQNMVEILILLDHSLSSFQNFSMKCLASHF